jgi:hypothetical protein
MITEAQGLFLRMLELTSVNNLDGPRIAGDLRAHASLWRSFVLTRVSLARTEAGHLTLAASPIDWLVLRDLHTGDLHYDTLLILPAPSSQSELETLARSWTPDELHWLGLKAAREILGGRRATQGLDDDPERVILRLWWD